VSFIFWALRWTAEIPTPLSLAHAQGQNAAFRLDPLLLFQTKAS